MVRIVLLTFLIRLLPRIPSRVSSGLCEARIKKNLIKAFKIKLKNVRICKILTRVSRNFALGNHSLGLDTDRSFLYQKRMLLSVKYASATIVLIACCDCDWPANTKRRFFGRKRRLSEFSNTAIVLHFELLEISIAYPFTNMLQQQESHLSTVQVSGQNAQYKKLAIARDGYLSY